LGNVPVTVSARCPLTFLSVLKDSTYSLEKVLSDGPGNLCILFLLVSEVEDKGLLKISNYLDEKYTKTIKMCFLHIYTLII